MAKKEGTEKSQEAREDKPAVVAATVAPQAATVEAETDKFTIRGTVRRRLPRTRSSKTYRFHIADLTGFFTVSEYDDGRPGELFINVSKQGSTLSGLMDSFAISVSHGLQYGVPLKVYVRTLMSTSFPPSGITDDPDIRTASSITDYIVRRLALDYLSFDDRLELGLASIEDMPDEQTNLLTDDQSATSVPAYGSATEHTVTEAVSQAAPVRQSVQQATSVVGQPTHDGETLSPKLLPGISTAADTTAPLCYNCGNQTQRAGSCYVCSSCGSTTGCS